MALDHSLLVAAALLGAVVVYRLLAGDVWLKGLLHSGRGGVEPDRVQALVIGMGAVACYAYQALRLAGPEVHSLPDVPTELLAISMASQAVFLAGKLARTMR